MRTQHPDIQGKPLCASHRLAAAYPKVAKAAASIAMRVGGLAIDAKLEHHAAPFIALLRSQACDISMCHEPEELNVVI